MFLIMSLDNVRASVLRNQKSAAVRGRRGFSLLIILLLSGLLLTGIGCPRPGAAAQPQGWAGPMVAEDLLYFVCGEGVLMALRIDDRAERWRFAPDPPLIVHGTPIVSGGRLFIGAYNGNIYSLDAYTGEKRWYFPTGGPIIGSPAITGNTLIVGSSDGKLYALDARNGDPLWREPFASGGPIWSTPVISGDVVYFGNLDHELYAVDLATGLPMWPEGRRFDGAIASTPLIEGRTLFIGVFDSMFYALDIATGDRRWEFIPFEAGNWFWTRPLLHEGTIFVGSLDHYIYALDARTGERDWAKRTGGKIRSAPVIVDDVLIVASYDGKIYGLDPRTGEERWAPIDIGVPILAHPWVEGSIVYIVDQQNTLHAIEAGTSSIVWPFVIEQKEGP